MKFFEIVDDDDIAYPGGFSALLPKTDLITSQVKKAYVPAYIEVNEAPQSYTNTDVPFYLNVPTTDG